MEKVKIKLSELTDIYDIEEDTPNLQAKNIKIDRDETNFDMEIEEVIGTAEKKLEKEFRDE